MSVLDKLNRFVMNPTTLDISRSKFKRPFTHKTTYQSGDLVPIFYDEVLPGDTFKIDINSVTRMLTPAVPVMDNAFLDVFFFFVPSRIATLNPKDWERICGENTQSIYANPEEVTLENTGNMFSLRTIFDEGVGSIDPGSCMNYMGLPILDTSNSPWLQDENNTEKLMISKMPFISYIKIWNEFFRDQNTQDPIEDFNECIYNHLPTACLKTNKFHDYFTSALIAPLKSAQSILIPLGESAPIQYATKASSAAGALGPFDSVQVSSGSSNFGYRTFTNLDNIDDVQSSQYPALGMVADLSRATGATINQLRQAFAIQRVLEADARGGTRYRESIKTHFGVTLPDYRAQVPEYLGGKRIPLNITQVLQTSQTSDTSPLGATGAFSNTANSSFICLKSFVEYGHILGVATVRTSQSYSQGIPKHFTRNRRYDWYLPQFANLGEQAIKRTELYIPVNGEAADSLDSLGEVFGYQEAWAEYRYHPDLVTGHLAPNSKDLSLSAWTYTNNFSNWPVLNSDFMVHPSSQLGDTLVVTNTKTQLISDFYFDIECTRPMPLYSIPGLIDHH